MSIKISTSELLRPVIARSETVRRPQAPTAFDCIRLVFMREGTAILGGETGGQPVVAGDVILIGSRSQYGYTPEGPVTATSVMIDSDYLLDQLFWQYIHVVPDRLAAPAFAQALYDPLQIAHLGEAHLTRLAPCLDELTELTQTSSWASHFFRIQTILSALADTLRPHVKTKPLSYPAVQRSDHIPMFPRWRRFTPIRNEIRDVETAMRADIARPWPLSQLSDIAHLSSAQVSRLFAQTYGKTPLAYLHMLRIEKMAKLLRETNLSVEAIGRQVGWSSRDHSSRMFRRYVGVSPRQYRQDGPFTTTPQLP